MIQRALVLNYRFMRPRATAIIPLLLKIVVTPSHSLKSKESLRRYKTPLEVGTLVLVGVGLYFSLFWSAVAAYLLTVLVILITRLSYSPYIPVRDSVPGTRT
jgi:hypothetical protein